MTVLSSECVEFMTQVIESEKGLKITFPTKGIAVNFRQRCATTRLRMQKRNTEFYKPDHPSYGKTAFDGISMHVREEDGKGVLIATKDGSDLNSIGKVEAL